MSALANELQRLLDFLQKRGYQAPTERLRIVEIGAGRSVDARGRIRLQRHEVLEPVQYEACFDELMKVGFPWMNVTCLGVIDGMLLVGVELPRVAPPEPAKRTSINLSGPMAKVLNSGWSAEEVLSIE